MRSLRGKDPVSKREASACQEYFLHTPTKRGKLDPCLKDGSPLKKSHLFFFVYRTCPQTIIKRKRSSPASRKAKNFYHTYQKGRGSLFKLVEIKILAYTHSAKARGSSFSLEIKFFAYTYLKVQYSCQREQWIRCLV